MHRRVHHLRLKSTRDEHARHGRVLLEDALRTASLGDEGRLIVVRHLDLGRISARASATQWSRRLEDTFRRTGVMPVHFDATTADRADAVYFTHPAEPWLVLAERAATFRATNQWFWPSAASGWTAALSTAETLRLCLRQLASHGGLRLTLQLATRLDTARALHRLLSALRIEDLAALSPSLLTADPSAPTHAATATAAHRTVPAPILTEIETSFVHVWGAHDVRTRWLAAWHAIRPNLSDPFAPATPPTASRLQEIITSWTAPAPPGSSERTPARASTSPTSATADPAPPDALEDEQPVAQRPLERPTLDRQLTRAGGLFFTLPLLARAGLPEHLTGLPPADATVLPWQILRLALQHARVPGNDPCLATLRDLPPSPHPLGRWLLAANRHALRRAQLNLRTLIARPALITLSPTRVDVFFRPGDADVRLRRATLDLDLGWVPWLGRVITFHFNRED